MEERHKGPQKGNRQEWATEGAKGCIVSLLATGLLHKPPFLYPLGCHWIVCMYVMCDTKPNIIIIIAESIAAGAPTASPGEYPPSIPDHRQRYPCI